MRAAWLALLMTLAPAATAAAGDDVALDAPPADLSQRPLTECLDGVECGVDEGASIGQAEVSVVHIDSGSDAETFVQVVRDAATVYFEIDDLETAMGHMTEEMYHERRDRAAIARGTLDGGELAAVVRVDWSSQCYREGAGRHGLEVKSRDPWLRHADVVVCALGAAPRCTARVRVDCPRRGCRARLAGGVLSITTRTGRETHRITR